MGWIALRMLTGDRVKYFGLLFGIAFSTLLIAQQASLFLNLIGRGAAPVNNITDADFWVMDPRAQQVDGTLPLPATDLQRVRGVPGVAWAVPYLREGASVRTPEGALERVTVNGVDDATLIGLPHNIVRGRAQDLYAPDAIMVDTVGINKLMPGVANPVGRTLELNDRRARIVGLVDAEPSFTAGVQFWTRYSAALDYVPGTRNRMSFVIGRAAPGVAPEEVARRITEKTGLRSRARDDFARDSIDYIVNNTGIPFNFGITVLLGFVVGAAIVGLTFSLFIRDNIRQFGALKAIGITNRRLVGMVALQAAHVAVIGYAFGIFLASLFFSGFSGVDAFKGFFLPWRVAVGAGVVVGVMVFATGFAAMRTVLKTEPAEVFR